ncbi:fusion protein [Canine pneumovirus]|nr:fusion protein [Canine pneumovirus]
MIPGRIFLVFLLIFSTKPIHPNTLTEKFYESTCSVETAGYKSALRTGWHMTVMSIKLSQVNIESCKSSNSLLAHELAIYSSAVDELRTLSSNALKSKRKKRFLGLILGLGAAVTAGVALAKTVQLESEIALIREAVRNTNEAVVSLTNGMSVLAKVVDDLKNFISKELLPKINRVSCDVHDITAVIRFQQLNKRLLEVSREFSSNAGLTHTVSSFMLTDRELTSIVGGMAVSAGQKEIMLSSRAIMRRNGLAILSSVNADTLVYIIQLPLFGVMDTDCWVIRSSIDCHNIADKYACLARADNGWYCHNAGSLSYFPSPTDCEIHNGYVFCDTLKSLTVPVTSRECNSNMYTTNYDCKISTSKTYVSTAVLTTMGCLVSCYGHNSCTVINNDKGIIRTLPDGCHYISNKGVDKVQVGNTVYYLSKEVGKSIVVRGEPLVLKYDPLSFPDDKFDVAIRDVEHSINQTRTFLKASDQLLDLSENRGNKSLNKSYILTTLLIVVMLIIIMAVIGFILYKVLKIIRDNKLKSKSTPGLTVLS